MPACIGFMAGVDSVRWVPRHHFQPDTLVRLLNRANMGTYRKAEQDIIATRTSDTIKYGFGLNVEQRITPSIGIFIRLGWKDGKTESWAFAEIDRTARMDRRGRWETHDLPPDGTAGG